ncbi:hypothetical protein ACGRHY_26380 [Streptomyces sp. HK10]|uniref:hypothetical protein n=1 Tax=Streptomyces sp. HK10 TaxID=3373255 RepID=UPI00374807EE
MSTHNHSAYAPPIGGMKHTLPELTDPCRPPGERTYPEHAYPAAGEARCRRCNATENNHS